MFCNELDQKSLFTINSNPTKISEHDIDFHIETSIGPMGIELVEDAPLSKGSYPELKSEFTSGERSNYIISLIINKSEKYKNYNSIKKALIIYTTDDKIALTGSIAALVIRYCHNNMSDIFDYIFYLIPHTDCMSSLLLFYPQTKEILEQCYLSDEKQLRQDGYLNIL